MNENGSYSRSIATSHRWPVSIPWLVPLLVGVVALSGACGLAAGSSALPDRLPVVASFYPLFEAAQRVGGRRVQVANLTPAGAEPHDLELSPKQVDQILDAGVVLYMGKGFQPAVEDAAAQRRTGVTVDLLAELSPDLRTLNAEGSIRGGLDPHVWLDPVLMGDMVRLVADALSRADPAGAETYRSNAALFRSKIGQLDQRYRTGLHGCARQVIVTSHAAFGYLATRYGLVQEPIAGLSPEAEPNPDRLAQLSDLVRRDGVTTIFTETLVSPRVADTLAREVGISTAVLDPLEGLTASEAAAGVTYVSVMDRNLATLRAALGCP